MLLKFGVVYYVHTYVKNDGTWDKFYFFNTRTNYVLCVLRLYNSITCCDT